MLKKLFPHSFKENGLLQHRQVTDHWAYTTDVTPVYDPDPWRVGFELIDTGIVTRQKDAFWKTQSRVVFYRQAW